MSPLDVACPYCEVKTGNACVAKAHRMKSVKLDADAGFFHPQRREAASAA